MSETIAELTEKLTANVAETQNPQERTGSVEAAGFVLSDDLVAAARAQIAANAAAFEPQKVRPEVDLTPEQLVRNELATLDICVRETADSKLEVFYRQNNSTVFAADDYSQALAVGKALAQVRDGDKPIPERNLDGQLTSINQRAVARERGMAVEAPTEQIVLVPPQSLH